MRAQSYQQEEGTGEAPFRYDQASVQCRVSVVDDDGAGAC